MPKNEFKEELQKEVENLKQSNWGKFPDTRAFLKKDSEEDLFKGLKVGDIVPYINTRKKRMLAQIDQLCLDYLREPYFVGHDLITCARVVYRIDRSVSLTEENKNG